MTVEKLLVIGGMLSYKSPSTFLFAIRFIRQTVKWSSVLLLFSFLELWVFKTFRFDYQWWQRYFQTFAQPPKDCGPMPTKKPTDCCQGLDKLIKEEAWKDCESTCAKPDMCCKGNCFATKLGFLKDGKFDKDTASKALAAAFGSDKAWNDVSDWNIFSYGYLHRVVHRLPQKWSIHVSLKVELLKICKSCINTIY